MSAPRPDRDSHPAAASAIGAVSSLLEAQRRALVAGDPDAIEAARARLQALLADPAWRRDAATRPARALVHAAITAAALNADLAARGEAHAGRALAALGAAPALYTSSGALGAPGARPRSVSA